MMAILTFIMPASVFAETTVTPEFSRHEIEAKWQGRIQLFLDRDQIPLIDLLSFLDRKNGEQVLSWTKKVMDNHGVALISFAGYWAPGGGKTNRYRWGYYIHEIANRYPDYFILTTNKGSNNNWWAQKNGSKQHFIGLLEQQIRTGNYPFIGQIEFRHYMSNSQCRARKTHRDIDIPLNGNNGHRIFSLSAATRIPFSIHLEPEDDSIATLEQMLTDYPKAKVIISHFGQIRHYEREQKFGPKLVRRLLNTYPNLYYDLSTGEPGRKYKCGNLTVLDTVIWENVPSGGQMDKIKSEYRDILNTFSDRFVVGFDYGPSNRQSESYLKKRIKNIRLIMRDLSNEAKHNIGYRNAWFLLTGKLWR